VKKMLRKSFSKVYSIDGGPASVHGRGPRVLQSKKVRCMLKILHDAQQDVLQSSGPTAQSLRRQMIER
jgi:hypothetical protein